MPTYNIQSSVTFGTLLAEDLLYDDGTLWSPAGTIDPRMVQRLISTDGLLGGDRMIDLPSVPSIAEITAHLEQLAAAFDDSQAHVFRRVYVGTDDDGNYTQILRDVSYTRP